MHLSSDESNASDNVMNGLNVTDYFLQFSHVTVVFYSPIKKEIINTIKFK